MSYVGECVRVWWGSSESEGVLGLHILNMPEVHNDVYVDVVCVVLLYSGVQTYMHTPLTIGPRSSPVATRSVVVCKHARLPSSSPLHLVFLSFFLSLFLPVFILFLHVCYDLVILRVKLGECAQDSCFVRKSFLERERGEKIKYRSCCLLQNFTTTSTSKQQLASDLLQPAKLSTPKTTTTPPAAAAAVGAPAAHAKAAAAPVRGPSLSQSVSRSCFFAMINWIPEFCAVSLRHARCEPCWR